MRYNLLILVLLFFVAKVSAQIQQEESVYSTRLIKTQQLEGLDITELQLLKDDIYARKGYTFSDEQKIIYYLQYSWYDPVQRNSLLSLNDVEKANVKLIDDKIQELLDSFTNTDESENLLSSGRINQLLTDRVKRYLGILFYNTPYVYSYKDGSVDSYIMLSENQYNYYNDSRPLYNNYIKALFCVREGSFVLKTYEINDLIDLRIGEFDIRFLPKYISVDDIDGDGIADPIIVYAAMGESGYADGWAKILIMYQKNLYTIYINNSKDNQDRMLNLSPQFYSLPTKLQDKAFILLETLQLDGFCYYSENWKEMLKERKTFIW